MSMSPFEDTEKNEEREKGSGSMRSVEGVEIAWGCGTRL